MRGVRDLRRLNAFTPLAIASTPVKADAPDENARSRTSTPTAPAPAASGFGATACGQVPTVQRAMPVPVHDAEGDDEAVGRDREESASLTPRRLTSAISPIAARKLDAMPEKTSDQGKPR